MAKSNKFYSASELVPLLQKYLLNGIAEAESAAKAEENLAVKFSHERELPVPFERSRFADATMRESFRGMRANQ